MSLRVIIRTSLGAVLLCGWLASASAQVTSTMVTGTIAGIDTAAGMITLTDGTSYVLPSADYLRTLKLGDHVTITFMPDKTGAKVASAVNVAT